MTTRWLLVPMGTILAVLPAIFLVSRLTEARSGTRQTLCVHNLKMFATALHRYAKNLVGRFPDRVSVEKQEQTRLALTLDRAESGIDQDRHPGSATHQRGCASEE